MWKDVGVIIYVGYILGFLDDIVEKIVCNIEIIKYELLFDLIEFFFFMLLLGLEDYKVFVFKGVWMDFDFNKYDFNYWVMYYLVMLDNEWDKVYYDSWK